MTYRPNAGNTVGDMTAASGNLTNTQIANGFTDLYLPGTGDFKVDPATLIAAVGVKPTDIPILSAFPSSGAFILLRVAGDYAWLPQELLPVGAASTPATSFTITAPANMTSGSASTVTVTPNSGSWNGQTITPTATTISGTFSPTSAVGSGSTPISFAFTPSATGSGSINASGSGLTSAGAVSVTVGAASAYAALSFTGTPTFETVSPLAGAASLKASASVSATATIAIPAAPDASAGGGNNADQGMVIGGFRIRGSGSYSGSGSFLSIGPSGRALLIGVSGTSMTASFGAGSTAMTSTPTIRDSASHWVSFKALSNGNKLDWSIYLDGVKIGGESQVAVFAYLPNGNQPLALDLSKMVVGDLIDDIWIRNSGDPTVVPSTVSRDGTTNVIWNFNGQSGVGS